MLSPYFNIGLLQHWVVIQAVETVDLEEKLDWTYSIEVCICPVLGWQEYKHRIYDDIDADDTKHNKFNPAEPLFQFCWNFLNCNWVKLKG